MRMDDLDGTREVPGAADHILRTLDAFGFEWDGPVLLQSSRAEAYADALERLLLAGRAFPCACSRKEIAAVGHQGPEGPVYPGTCRHRLPENRSARSVRLRVDRPPIAFDDRIQGHMSQDLALSVGDFVLRRVDGIHAYQLAVVVDDAEQGINQVVRGVDLMLSTPRQIFLQRSLGLDTPIYAHLPLVLDAEGRKLSKSDASAPVDPRDPLASLKQAWTFLRQEPFIDPPATLAEFWQQAIPSWDTGRIAAKQAVGKMILETAVDRFDPYATA